MKFYENQVGETVVAYSHSVVGGRSFRTADKGQYGALFHGAKAAPLAARMALSGGVDGAVYLNGDCKLQSLGKRRDGGTEKSVQNGVYRQFVF